MRIEPSSIPWVVVSCVWFAMGVGCDKEPGRSEAETPPHTAPVTAADRSEGGTVGKPKGAVDDKVAARAAALDTRAMIAPGTDALVVGKPGGLYIVALDGTKEVALDHARVLHVTVDPWSRTVWYSTGPQDGAPAVDLWVMDYSGPPKKVKVASGLPNLPLEVRLVEGHWVRPVEASPQAGVLVIAAAKVGPGVVFELEPGEMELLDPEGVDQAKALLSKAPKTVRGLQGLDTIRTPRTKAPVWIKLLPQAPKVEVDRSRCEEASLCGEARPFGRTGWFLVVTAHGCGDSCTVEQLIYDPAKAMFASPLEPGKLSKDYDEMEGVAGPVAFDASGKRWFVEGSLCTERGCREVEGVVGGFLYGTYRLD